MKKLTSLKVFFIKELSDMTRRIHFAVFQIGHVFLERMRAAPSKILFNKTKLSFCLDYSILFCFRFIATLHYMIARCGCVIYMQLNQLYYSMLFTNARTGSVYLIHAFISRFL